MRDRILDSGLSLARAQHILNTLDGEAPWYSPMEYITAMAALSRVYDGEMQRKTVQQGRPICSLLRSATDPERMGWFFNGIRMRREMDPCMVSLMGSGTSPNEALHAEVNRWFRNQPDIYSTTVGMQLRVCHLGKLLTHNAAMYAPTLRQMDQQSLLHMTAASFTIPASEWSSWCAELVDSTRSTLKPASLPISLKRKRIFEKIKATPKAKSVLRRPAADVLRRPAAVVRKVLKRTPFTLKRIRG